MNHKQYELNEQIHAILINPYLSSENFKLNCNLIKKYGINNVSTSLQYLPYLKESMIKEKTNINVLISYPFSDIPQMLLNDLLLYAKDNGANVIEYTPKFFFLSNNKEENFANGRFVRNMYNNLILEHAKRVSQIDNPDVSDLHEIELQDVERI